MLAPSPAADPAGPPLRTEGALLLVDDHEDNLFALEHALAPLGRWLLRATSGEQALKAVLRHPVATVVMDIEMHGIDGLDTMSYLSRLDQTREVPVLLITGTGRDDRLAERVPAATTDSPSAPTVWAPPGSSSSQSTPGRCAATCARRPTCAAVRIPPPPRSPPPPGTGGGCRTGRQGHPRGVSKPCRPEVSRPC
ncbi:two-component system response regulator [Streptomyces violascens]|uniref:response regulator n=1 Tax=Streptomyces violascens TaxID=67381 RepID=UPI00364A07CC